MEQIYELGVGLGSKEDSLPVIIHQLWTLSPGTPHYRPSLPHNDASLPLPYNENENRVISFLRFIFFSMFDATMQMYILLIVFRS